MNNDPKKPIIIEFEGIDKSGKETQAELAVEYLREQGILVNDDYTMSFPDYNTYSGSIIRQCLDTGVPHHPVKNANEFQSMMILNRYEKQHLFTEYGRNNSLVVCDRYMTSMIVYGRLSGVDDVWSMNAQHRMYQPTLTIVLDISLDEYKKRCSAYSLDIYEQDTTFIEKVKNSYLDTSVPWQKVVIDGQGSKEEVHERVKILLEQLKKKTLHM